MDNNDIVSFDLAKRLKECGFNEPCNAYWYKSRINSDEMALSIINNYADHNNDDWYVPHCSAPTLWQAQKWLREKKNVDLEIRVCLVDAEREYRPYVLLPNDLIALPTYKQYEQALQEGIHAALELINPTTE